MREKKSSRSANLSIRCARYKTCEIVGSTCDKCSTTLMFCKNCKTRSCIDVCANYERVMCPKTKSWPYVCVEGCPKRAHCGYPKCSYNAADADSAYRDRLKSSREGIDLSQDSLDALCVLITPLVKQGQSFEAIWATHGDELPICTRSAYNYQERGILTTANIDLPRKVRIKKRNDKKDEPVRERINRAGRTFADFLKLALCDQVRVVQGDSVEGFENNEQDILSLHIVSRAFQIYLLKKHASAQAVVEWFDFIERASGSRAAFEAVLGILLVDRGIEFDDWEGMERSCLEPGQRRCRVFYCDALQSNQKSQAERNHEQLRRILPKSRSNFDALSTYDVALCSSHVNSYPSAGRNNKCPFELLGSLLSQSLLDELGISRVAPDDVVLRPSLIAHAVVQ